MAQSMVNFRIDNDLKKSMEETCSDLGLSMSAAITMFIKKVTREKRIPFDVSIDPFYSSENQKYLAALVKDIEAGKVNLTPHDLIGD